METTVGDQETGTAREAIRLVAGVWTLAFLVMLASSLSGTVEPASLAIARSVLAALIGIPLSLILWNYAARPAQTSSVRLWVLVPGVVLATAAHVGADLVGVRGLRWLMRIEPPRSLVISDNPMRAFLMELLVQSNVVVLAGTYAFFAMAAAVLIGAIETRERDNRLAEVEASATAAQLAALRYQLNPHFLFNTLNAIGSLVDTGRPDQARNMIDQLADFMRSALTDKSASTVTLDDELSTMQEYLAIEAQRFGSRLSVRFDCSAELCDARIPGFILQPLIENALKHAVAPALEPVTVTVSARREGGDLILTVADTAMAGAGKASAGTGVGLSNTRRRLDLHYGVSAELAAMHTADGFRSVIRLPFSKADPANG